MNVDLLKRARRDRHGLRRWTVPQFTNHALLIPAAHTPPGWGAAFKWPGPDARGDEIQRSVDLAQHRALARRAARDLIAGGAQV